MVASKAICRSSVGVIALCLGISARSQVATVPAPPPPSATTSPAKAPVTPPQTAASTAPADIVVTASKREQKLRDVPSAISVLSGDALETQGVQSVRDYATLTPGLGQRDLGRPGVGTIFLRGLTTGSGQQSATSVVYLDDVAFTSSSPESGSAFIAPEPELADIDRIEVLKGPQGTLYGASSLGGVIRIVTKRPDAKTFSGNARVEGTAVDGGGEGYLARASVNVPIVTDRLAVRATGFYRKAPGYTDNVGTGSKDVNDSISKGGRIELGWTPTDRLRIDIAGQIQNTDTDGIAYQSNVSGTRTPIFGPRKYDQFFNANSRIRQRLVSGTATYDTDIGSLIGTVSYLHNDTRFEIDYTPSFGAYLPVFGYPATTAASGYTDIDLNKQTAELRFVSKRLGRFEIVAGGFQTHEHTVAPTRINAVDRATNTPLPGLSGLLVRADIVDTYDEAAGFGNVTFYLTDRLDVTGGLRYAHNREKNALTFGGVFYGADALPPQNSRFDDNVLTYLATVRWRPTDTFSTFVRAASGYRPGGPQTNPAPPPGAQTSIRPDTVWNYEAGFKGDFLDRKISVEASGYHIDWRNVQLTTVVNSVVLLANAGKAEINGFEAQVTARPSPLLTAAVNLAYTDTRIANISPGASLSIGARKGDPLPLTPKWTASAVADQRIPLNDHLDALLGATARYQSHMFNSYPASAVDPNVRLKNIATLDLRAGLGLDRYQLQFRLENAFDRNGITNISTTPGTPSLATVIRPRSFTLSLGVQL